MDGMQAGGLFPALDELDEERRIRTELACAYRLVDHFGWTRAHLRPSHRAPAGAGPPFPHQSLRAELR